MFFIATPGCSEGQCCLEDGKWWELSSIWWPAAAGPCQLHSVRETPEPVSSGSFLHQASLWWWGRSNTKPESVCKSVLLRITWVGHSPGSPVWGHSTGQGEWKPRRGGKCVSWAYGRGWGGVLCVACQDQEGPWVHSGRVLTWSSWFRLKTKKKLRICHFYWEMLLWLLDKQMWRLKTRAGLAHVAHKVFILLAHLKECPWGSTVCSA